MIRVRFDSIVQMSNHHADSIIGYANLPQVPAPGQLVNINGDPYIVHEIAWAVVTEPSDDPLYAYVRVVNPNRETP